MFAYLSFDLSDLLPSVVLIPWRSTGNIGRLQVRRSSQAPETSHRALKQQLLPLIYLNRHRSARWDQILDAFNVKCGVIRL